MSILVGADPELFLKKDGRFVSAYGLIKGDKLNPYKVDKGAVQVDGMAAEFNIDPAENQDQFTDHIKAVMRQLAGMVEGYELSATPTAHFDPEIMASQPDEALELGCEPDISAYTMENNPTPDASGLNIRTGGGHIHIGFCNNEDPFSFDHILRCAFMARQLDVWLGVPSLTWDRDAERRSLYGLAGAFRAKPYGMEYRPLSNAWLSSDELMSLVYTNAVIGVERLLKGNRDFQNINVSQIINNSEIDNAVNLCNELGVSYV